MKKEDGEKARYTATDTSEFLNICGCECSIIDPCLPNCGLLSLKPKKFSIKDDKNDAVFNLMSTMFQFRNFNEQRCDQAIAMTFLRPRYQI
jgi:hypothetical protein